MTIIDKQSGVNELSLVESAVNVITGSANAQDMCKRLVHADFADGGIKGAFVYSIDDRSSLVELAGYGLPFESPTGGLLIWTEHPISECVRTKSLICETNDSNTLICLPFTDNGVPNGALVIVCNPDAEIPSVREELITLLGRIGGYFLNTSGMTLSSAPRQSSPAVSLEEVTTRQVTILGMMADGMTNAEIAAKVLLSESKVRQETIRIYRALAVGGRLEAVAKGRALGLISKVTPPRT